MPTEPTEHIHVARRLDRLRRLTRLLDSSIRIPGTGVRVGLDPILGLIPGAGDLIPAVVSLYVVDQARRLGVRRRTLGLMLGNIVIDLLIGAIPVLGDLFDFAFKANTRNLRLLEHHLFNSAATPTSTMRRHGPRQ